MWVHNVYYNVYNYTLNIVKDCLVLVVTGKSGESSETQLEGEYHLVGVKVGQIGDGGDDDGDDDDDDDDGGGDQCIVLVGLMMVVMTNAVQWSLTMVGMNHQ